MLEFSAFFPAPKPLGYSGLREAGVFLLIWGDYDGVSVPFIAHRSMRLFHEQNFIEVKDV